MTIMLAGGLTFAVPGMEPAFAANANLFVSAENSQFDNYMSGPQVIEVVIIDSDINDTDEAKGEPDVTVNGKILRMVQAVDGNCMVTLQMEIKHKLLTLLQRQPEVV